MVADEFYTFVKNDVITINPVIIAPSKTFHDFNNFHSLSLIGDSICMIRKVRYKIQLHF